MLNRREILGLLAVAGTAPALALGAPAQEREPWAKFRQGPDYPRFVEAVRRMKANPDASSPDSWAFWPEIHRHHCPHGKDYFLAWHRGYLHLFEARLRAISGSATLRVPYWDYFADPRVPAELSAGNSATNPLFEPRIGGDVGKALAYAAFEPKVTGFQRGAAECFEAKVEAFHNNVHNLIGGRMATMLSPQDVIFWLHHANVDRLWSAWAAAGEGRTMPAPDDAYWGGRFDYADALGLERAKAASGEGLGYRYADLRLPSLAPGGGPPPPPRVAAAPPPPVEAAPPRAMAPAPAAPAPIPFRGIWLGREDRRVRMPLARSHGYVPDEVTIVLDAVSLTREGEAGGYFYQLYLDLDEGDERTRPECLLGSLGPFQIAAALHHGDDGKARIELPVGEVIREVAPGRDPTELGVLFVRIDAGGPPAGDVIGIGTIEIAS